MYLWSQFDSRSIGSDEAAVCGYLHFSRKVMQGPVGNEIL